MSTTLDEARETVAEAMLPRLGPRNAVAWAIARQRAEAIETISRAVFREETARSRAPVGEGYGTINIDQQGNVTEAWVGSKPTPPAKDTGAALPRWFIDHDGAMRSSPIGYYTEHYAASQRIADLEARLAEAEDQASETRAFIALFGAKPAEMVGRLERERDEARSSLAREEKAHLDTIDRRDIAESWADKLARAIGGEDIGHHSNLNNPWANALEIAERDEARSLLETAERRIGELEAEERHRVAWMTEALRQTAAMAAGRMPMAGELGVTHIRAMPERIEGFSSAKLGRWLGWAQAAVVAGGCATLDDVKNLNKRCSDAALTPDAGTGRSEDEEGK